MFIPTLMGQGTVNQQAEWIQRAWGCDIIGTYAQVSIFCFNIIIRPFPFSPQHILSYLSP